MNSPCSGAVPMIDGQVGSRQRAVSLPSAIVMFDTKVVRSFRKASRLAVTSTLSKTVGFCSAAEPGAGGLVSWETAGDAPDCVTAITRIENQRWRHVFIRNSLRGRGLDYYPCLHD